MLATPISLARHRDRCAVFLLSVVVLCGFALLAKPQVVNATAPQPQQPCGPGYLEQVYQRFAVGDSEHGFAALHACVNQLAGEAEFDLSLGIAALEVSEFSVAQAAFKRLATLTKQNTQAQQNIDLVYDALVEQRVKAGSSISSNSSRYLAADPKVLLNINFNRAAIGLPYVLPLAKTRGAAPVVKAPGVKGVQATPSAPVALDHTVNADLAEAKRLLEQQNPQAAYTLLSVHEFAGSGHVEFDYVFGTAAVEAGQPETATLTLARVLNQKPKHAGARMELARALYALGELAESREQFTKLLAQNPPPFAATVAKNYLAAIDTQLKALDNQLVTYIDTRIGYSTNANGATANEQPFRGLAGVPSAVQNLALDQQSLEKASSFAAVSVGVDYSRLLKPRWFMKTGAVLSGQSNPNAHFVDTHAGSAYWALEKRVAQNFVNVGLDTARNYVDGDFSAKSLGLNVVAGRSLSEQWTGTVQSRVAWSRYQPTQAAKDSSDYTLSVAAAKSWPGQKQLGTSVALIGQRIDADSATNSKDVLGLALGAQWLLNAQMQLVVSGVYLEANYDAPILGSSDREDNSALLGLGLTHFSATDPNLKWFLNVDANETRSSLSLFDADGIKFTVGARYDFR